MVRRPPRSTRTDTRFPSRRSSDLVDGMWGTSTTRRLQKVLGTSQDGTVSSQNSDWRASNPGLTLGWQWVGNPRGSRVIAALQDVLGVRTDGILGPDSIRARSEEPTAELQTLMRIS